MSAAYSEVSVENGMANLHCLACGAPVFTQDEGLADQLCRHVLFVVDWSGEILVPDVRGRADALPAVWADLEALWDSAADFESSVASVRAALPKSALVLQIEEPSRGGGHDGSELIIGFDLSS